MSNVESASNPKPVNSGFGDPWTPDEKQRLYELRQQYKNLTWQEFQMRFYPKRSKRTVEQRYYEAPVGTQTLLNRLGKHKMNLRSRPAKRAMRAVTEDESHTDTDESESEESHDGVITDIQHSGQDTLTSASVGASRQLVQNEIQSITNEAKFLSQNTPKPLNEQGHTTNPSMSSASRSSPEDVVVQVTIPTEQSIAARSKPRPVAEKEILHTDRSHSSVLTFDDLERCEDGIWGSIMTHAAAITKKAANYKTEKARADAAVASEQKALEDVQKYKEELASLQSLVQKQNSMIEQQRYELEEAKKTNETLKKDFEDFKKMNSVAIQKDHGGSRCEACKTKDGKMKEVLNIASDSHRYLSALFSSLRQKHNEFRTHSEECIHPNFWSIGLLPSLANEIEEYFHRIEENMTSIRNQLILIDKSNLAADG